VSYLKFAFMGVALNQYSGMSFYCTPAQLQNINFVRVAAATPTSTPPPRRPRRSRAAWHWPQPRSPTRAPATAASPRPPSPARC
jgi:hypothetical protein